MNVKSGQTKSPRRLYLQLASGKLARRAPCIYRTAAFENHTIGKTLTIKIEVRELCLRRFVEVTLTRWTTSCKVFISRCW